MHEDKKELVDKINLERAHAEAPRDKMALEIGLPVTAAGLGALLRFNSTRNELAENYQKHEMGGTLTARETVQLDMATTAPKTFYASDALLGGVVPALVLYTVARGLYSGGRAIRNPDSVLRQVARGTSEGLSYLGDYVRDLKETRKVR